MIALVTSSHSPTAPARPLALSPFVARAKDDQLALLGVRPRGPAPFPIPERSSALRCPSGCVAEPPNVQIYVSDVGFLGHVLPSACAIIGLFSIGVGELRRVNSLTYHVRLSGPRVHLR